MISTELAGSNIFDPFISNTTADLFRAWLQSKEEELEKYEKELEIYAPHFPEFMLKSADRLILDNLELIKSAKIPEPSKTLHQLFSDVDTRLRERGKEKPFITILLNRLTEDLSLIEAYKNKDKEAFEKLKDRGFIG